MGPQVTDNLILSKVSEVRKYYRGDLGLAGVHMVKNAFYIKGRLGLQEVRCECDEWACLRSKHNFGWVSDPESTDFLLAWKLS
jgi:hypothetical protein